MARKHHPSLKSIQPKGRKEESLVQKKVFLIACEGICTEPNYINGLVKIEKLRKNIAEGTEVIIAEHQHSDPLGVVKDLLSTPYAESFDERWIVIDRDEIEIIGKGGGGHTKENFDKAVETCISRNIKIACSNPCFELWIVLHFEYRDSECSRKDIQIKALEKVNSLLSADKKIKRVEDMKSLDNLYELLEEKRDTAIKFSRKLSENEATFRNPSTGIHKLISSICSADTAETVVY